MSFWMRTIRKLNSIAHGTYNARKFWTRWTSGSVHGRTIAWKYAYKNLTLHSRSPTHSVVTNIRSSARDWSLRIDYWTLNSRNVNSIFAASGRFFHSRSQMVPPEICSRDQIFQPYFPNLDARFGRYGCLQVFIRSVSKDANSGWSYWSWIQFIKIHVSIAS